MRSPSSIADLELNAQKVTGEKRSRGDSEDSIGAEIVYIPTFSPIVPAEEQSKKPRPSCPAAPKTNIINGRESVTNLQMGNLSLNEGLISSRK